MTTFTPIDVRTASEHVDAGTLGLGRSPGLLSHANPSDASSGIRLN